jgi:hypothetical protein
MSRTIPYRYRDIERLAKFQNRLFARYARVHGIAFIDVAGQLPSRPDLFLDAVHASYAGTRLRGWITFTSSLPTDREAPRRQVVAAPAARSPSRRCRPSAAAERRSVGSSRAARRPKQR